MLTKYFLEAGIFLIGQVLGIISSVFPGWDELTTLTNGIQTLFGVSTQVQNFFYFMFGDYLGTAVLMVSILLPIKFVAVPLISFLRKFIVWGG